MTKSRLIDAIHKKDNRLTKLQVSEVVDAMIEAMTTALAQGGKVGRFAALATSRSGRGRPGKGHPGKQGNLWKA